MPPRKYLMEGIRLSVQLARYEPPPARRYARTGKTRTLAVQTEREAAAFWRYIEEKISEWERA